MTRRRNPRTSMPHRPDMTRDQFLASGFLDLHLLCGNPVWPEGRSPTLAELPALRVTAELFDTFAEVTWTCTVCRESVFITIDQFDDPETWRTVVDARTRPWPVA